MTPTQYTLLKDLIANGGRLVNLRSTVSARYPDLNDAVHAATRFLDGDEHVKFNERAYCLINGLTARPLNSLGQPAHFVNYHLGYSMCEDSGRKSKKGQENRKKLEERRETTALARSSAKDLHLQEARRIMTNIGSDNEVLGESIRVANSVYKKRNPHLWDSDKEPGRDYIECPLTGTRKTFITEAYIRSLGLTKEEYFTLCGGEFNLVSDARRISIKNAMGQVDEETGMTIHQKVIQAARVTLGTIDPETGLTRDQLRANKTRATHMANVDEFGRNGYSQLASKAIIKGNQTKRDRGLILPEEDQPAFNIYSSLVRPLSVKLRSQFSKELESSDPDVTLELDHRYSVVAGFRDRVSPAVISHTKNHEVITSLENITKHGKCSVELVDLLTECGYTPERNRLEGELFRQVIEESVGAGLKPSEIWDTYNQRLSGLQNSSGQV